MHRAEGKFLDSFFSSHERKIKGEGNVPQGKIIGCYLTVAKNMAPVLLLYNLSKQTYSENGNHQ